MCAPETKVPDGDAPDLIRLPPLTGSLEAADYFVDNARDVRGKIVVVDCLRLYYGSRGFADRFVTRMIQERGAAGIDFVGAIGKFWDYIVEAATSIGAADRVRSTSTGRLFYY